MRKYIVFLNLLVILFIPKLSFATENSFITIVNPVRISNYNSDPQASILAQYQEISKRDLAATWLLTYDALNHLGIEKVIAKMDELQEIGIFLEITENFANEAGVVYNKTDSWHRANSVLTTGYTQTERIKLIDTVFKKYKDKYGIYPASVGAWWIDSFSLNYIKEKYKITANLVVADQFSTDGYGVWGQYFSTPFYPSRNHAGMPAGLKENKIDIVTMQWAHRDPVNSLGISEESKYSTQDYQTLSFPNSYYSTLIDIYAFPPRSSFGQITLGLEADLSPQNYSGLFAKQLDIMVEFEKNRGVVISTMKDFANWYRQKFPEISPIQIIEAYDPLDLPKKVIWYNSPKYRIGLIYDSFIDELKIVDFRVYHDNFQEPFYLMPNKQLELIVRNPSIIDNVQDRHSFWSIQGVSAVNYYELKDEFIIEFPIGQLNLKPEQIEIRLPFDLPKLFDSPFLDSRCQSDTPKLRPHKINEYVGVWPDYVPINKVCVVDFKKDYPFPIGGLIIKSLPAEFLYFTNPSNLIKVQNIKRLGILGAALVVLSIVIMFVRRSKYKWFIILWNKKNIGIGFLMGMLLILFNLESYYISQAELDALMYLKSQPEGRVVVINQDCIKCQYHSIFRPAVFANRREYVEKISGKDLVYNRTIFFAKDRSTGRTELDKLKAKYIYVVKYEDSLEKLPFSPGDYNLDLIYENANSQLWKIKSSF